MRIKALISLFIILFAGCASVELTEEEKQKLQQDKVLFSEQVIEPIIYLIASTCAYKASKNNWPDINLVPGEKSLFLDYIITNNSNNLFQNKFKIKSSGLLWNLKLNYDPTKEAGQCIFTLDAGTSTNPSSITFSGDLDISNSNEWEKSPANDIGNGARLITSFLYSPYQLIEKYKPYEAPKEYAKFKSLLGEILFKAGICILLDVESRQCH